MLVHVPAFLVAILFFYQCKYEIWVVKCWWDKNWTCELFSVLQWTCWCFIWPTPQSSHPQIFRGVRGSLMFLIREVTRCCFLTSVAFFSLVHLQRFILWRRPVALQHADLLSDLDDGEGDGDPGGSREDPSRLVHILLILLVLRLLGRQCGGCRGQVTNWVLALHQVDGGNGNGAGGDRDVFCQDFVLCEATKDSNLSST